MKNPKILYILISILCVLAIIAGIYAQFFVKAEDKNNVIVPTPTKPEQDEQREKTAKEINDQFISLFTNVLNSGEYDASNIIRLFDDKEIIYSAYDIEKITDNYEVNIHLPVMNIKGDVASSFNNITQTIFANKASEILKSENNNNVVYDVNYTAYINGDILSLAIEGKLKEGSNPQRNLIQTYNYNLATGEKVKIEELLEQKNLNKEDVQQKINETIAKAKEEAEIQKQSGYPVYDRDLNNDMYKLENISNYFLGPDENLYIIFAYGNRNYTTGMDIVLYE